MAVSHGLRRLLRVRELEEEQRHLALEAAMEELHRIEDALDHTSERGRKGRELVTASAHSGKLTDRFAGLEESRIAARQAEALADRFSDAEAEVTELRESYLSTRVERRQAEALIEETETRDAVEAKRRNQQDLDDWHRSRANRKGGRS